MKTPSLAWRPLRGLRGYHVVGLVAVVAILLLSTAPMSAVGPAIPYGDKLQHTLAYLLLSGWFAQLLDGSRSRTWLAVGLFSFGLGVEGVQSLLQWRSAELADLLANSVGIALGLLLTIGRGSRLLEALEARWQGSRSSATATPSNAASGSETRNE